MKEVQLAHREGMIASLYKVRNSPLAQDFQSRFPARLDPRHPEGQRQQQAQVAYIMRVATRRPIRPEHVTLASDGTCTVQVPTDVSWQDIAQGMRIHFPWLRPDVLQPQRLTGDQWAATPLTTPEGWSPLDLHAMARNLRHPVTAAQLLGDRRRGALEAFGHYMRDRGIERMLRSDTQAGCVVMHYADGRESKCLRVDAMDIRAGTPIKHFLRDLSGMPFERHAANALDKDLGPPPSARREGTARAASRLLTHAEWAMASLNTPPGWPPLDLQGIAPHLPLGADALLQMQDSRMAQAAGHYLKSRGIERLSRSADKAGHVTLQFAQGPASSVRLDHLDSPHAEGAAALMHFLRDLGHTPPAQPGQRTGPPHYTAIGSQSPSPKAAGPHSHQQPGPH